MKTFLMREGEGKGKIYPECWRIVRKKIYQKILDTVGITN